MAVYKCPRRGGQVEQRDPRFRQLAWAKRAEIAVKRLLLHFLLCSKL